ncbi:hypothetical protein BJ912DRAFT_1064125 [Pholiota molesta]|nr:hypothetical protein BJ912DRAFT_1064125 [Pholiota molesta]
MASLISHFGTNYTPTDEELLEIRSLLVAPTAGLAELDAEMARKLAEHEALHRQHMKLSLEFADYRALASPMRRLPIDVLREILIHCLPTGHNAILSHKEAPILLTHVCSAWRTIAFTTPALWASMHMPVPPPLADDRIFMSEVQREKFRIDTLNVVRQRTRSMEEWLMRSGACRLSISLYDQEHFNEDANANYEGFLDIIIPHSKRWHSMSFSTSVNCIQRIAALSADDVPALEEIDINMTSFFLHLHIVGEDPIKAMAKWTDSSFFSAPRLHRVSFKNLNEDINTLPLRWQQLTHISLTGTTVGAGDMRLRNITELLMKCPMLISAKLEISYYEPTLFATSHSQPSQSTYTNPIVLSNLADLSVHNGGSELSAFFAMLDVPRLTTLEYTTNDTAAVQPACQFIALLERISGTLTSLTTDAQMYSRKDFLAVLKAARRIKTFSNHRRKLIRSQRLWADQGHNVQHYDDTFLGMLVGRRLRSVEKVNRKVDVYTEPEEVRVKEPGETIAEDYSQILLPELESLNCHLPVSFTDEGLLEFLSLRQNPVQGAAAAGTSILSDAPYTRLQHCSIDFAREKTRPMSEEIEAFKKAGLALYLSYLPTESSGAFSPAEGILSKRIPFYPS